MSKYSNMTGSELVSAYNTMAEQASIEAVKRFATTDIGIKRCIELERKLGGTVDTAPKEILATKEEPAVIIPKRAKTPKPVKVKDLSLFGQFEARAGTVREKVIKVLYENLDKQVNVTEILKIAYGKTDYNQLGALAMVLKGVNVMITKYKIPLKLERLREGKEISYGLHKTD